MAGSEAGDQPGDRAGRESRLLERAPGERYVRSETADQARMASGGARSSLVRPLVNALLAAAIGSAVLFALGALLAETAGLLIVAGLTGAAVGLLFARAAAPGGGDEPALTRQQVTRLAVALVIAAVIVATLATWLHAVGEGGSLGLLDYVLETFGALVPLEVALAALAAAWGAGAGPVER